MERSGALSVYIRDAGPRSSWIFNLIFEELLGIRISITSDPAEFRCVQGPKFNYSEEHFTDIPAIVPYGLLSEQGLQQQDIRISDYRGLPVFFQNTEGDLPFDMFSMAFFLVSRYEEYLPYEPDQHGRFPHRKSLAYQQGFLDSALVNRLALLLGDLLKEHYPELRLRPPGYRFIPTFDVDIAFAHLGKGFTRSCGAMLRLLLKGKMSEIRSRLQTMLGRANDPYDNFNLIIHECRKYDLDPVFFILAGDRGPHDNNLSLNSRRFSALVNMLSQHGDIGVHPSYRSGEEAFRTGMEMARIADVTGKKISSSRQHFVRIRFPDTYNNLIKYGIRHDYSMGYAGTSGFRASIASPFYFYDLIREKATDLRIVPFMFMDTALSDYLGLRPDAYYDAIKPLIEEVKYCGGQLTAIWHNYAMANDKEKHEAFKIILKSAAAK